MKAIGCVIAYFKNHNNYGTSLQGFATIKAIEHEGYKCRLIQYQKSDSLFKKIRLAPLMFISGGWQAYKKKIKKKKITESTSSYAKDINIRTSVNNQWKSQYMDSYCDLYIGYNNLKSGSKNYGLIIVGSDQVWTPLGLYSKFFNLLFVDDSIPRMSYASSFGVSKIPSWQIKTTCKYLDKINKLSVREIRGKEIIEEISHNKAQVVLDPTLLLSQSQWREEIGDKKPKAEGKYIFCYLLGKDEKVRKEINHFKKITGLKIVAMRHIDEFIACDGGSGDEAPYNIDPLDFVQLIANAEFVCTDSFHCTVFSTIFHKQFVTFYRFLNTNSDSRNSRIDSILNLLGLEDRLYNGNLTSQMFSKIDYNTVEQKKNPLLKSSLEFLKSGLALSKK